MQPGSGGAAPAHQLLLCAAGDKTVAMWLMNAELYDGMSTFEEASPVVVRGMALHKMIHGLTMAIGVPVSTAPHPFLS